MTKGIAIASGCYMLARTRSLTKQLSNDSHFLYFEDFDLSLKIANIGPLPSDNGLSISVVMQRKKGFAISYCFADRLSYFSTTMVGSFSSTRGQAI